MKTGIPEEIRNNENRVSCTPAGVFALREAGHEVYVGTSVGAGSDFLDKEYEEAGAQIKAADEVFALANLIVKVKEYLPQEYHYPREDQLVFVYLHIVSDKVLANALPESETTATAHETVRDRKGGLPLLTPASEVAGRMVVQVGVTMLQKSNGGRGLLLGGVPGVLLAEAMVIGGSTVGLNAAKAACGSGVIVTIFDISTDRMGYIDDISGGTIHTAYNNEYNLCRVPCTADFVIGVVLVPGAKTPKIATEDMVKAMKPGSAIVDVAIDQGGCTETSDHITTHDDPYFERYGVMHYFVANISSAVSRTSIMALSSATLSYILGPAEKGVDTLKEGAGFLVGLNTCKGHITCQGVSDALQLPYADPMELLQAQKGQNKYHACREWLCLRLFASLPYQIQIA